MASPTFTYPCGDYVIVESYSGGSVTLDSTRAKLAKVVQVNSKSEPLAVNNLIVYNPENEIRFIQSGSVFSLIKMEDIALVYT